MANLKFMGYKVNEMSFKVNPEAKGESNFKIIPKIRLDIKQAEKNLLLAVTVTIDKHQPTPTPFELNINLLGSFVITQPAEIPALRDEAIATLFPYVRSTVSAITVTANMPAYFLPPLNFASQQDNKGSGSVIIRPLDEDI
ncbi:MAG: protein-export chaperone SecB [Clostridia bacterium]